MLLLLVQLQRIDKAMGDESPGLFFGLLFFQPGHIAVIPGGKANFFFKEGAEGAEAFKAYLVAHFHNGFIVIDQQFLCSLQPHLCNVLVRRALGNAGEESVKMKA